MCQKITDSEIDELHERLGGLADRDTARQILEARAEENDSSKKAVGPNCELCGPNKSATTLGVLCVNNRAYPNTPLCDDCFIPFEDIELPHDVNRKKLSMLHSDSPIN